MKSGTGSAAVTVRPDRRARLREGRVVERVPRQRLADRELLAHAQRGAPHPMVSPPLTSKSRNPSVVPVEKKSSGHRSRWRTNVRAAIWLYWNGVLAAPGEVDVGVRQREPDGRGPAPEPGLGERERVRLLLVPEGLDLERELLAVAGREPALEPVEQVLDREVGERDPGRQDEPDVAAAVAARELELVRRRLDQVIDQVDRLVLVVDLDGRAGPEGRRVEVVQRRELPHRPLDGGPAVRLARDGPDLAPDHVLLGPRVAGDPDVAELVDVALGDLVVEVERVAGRLDHGRLDVEPEVAGVLVQARHVGVVRGIAQVPLELAPIVDVATLDAQGELELLVGEQGVPLEHDVADLVLGPLLDLDLDHQPLLAVGLGDGVDRVADDAGAVVPAVVVERDEPVQVLVERGVVERLALPEPPPPALLGLLELPRERPVGERLVPLEPDVGDRLALAAVDVEHERDAAVGPDAAAGGHLGPAVPLLAEERGDLDLGPLDVGVADGPAPEQREPLAELLDVGPAQPVDLERRQLGLLGDLDHDLDPVAGHRAGRDGHVGVAAAAVQVADGLAELGVPRQNHARARAEPGDGPDEPLAAGVGRAADGDRGHLGGLGLGGGGLGSLGRRRRGEGPQGEGGEGNAHGGERSGHAGGAAAGRGRRKTTEPPAGGRRRRGEKAGRRGSALERSPRPLIAAAAGRAPPSPRRTGVPASGGVPRAANGRGAGGAARATVSQADHTPPPGTPWAARR